MRAATHSIPYKIISFLGKSSIRGIESIISRTVSNQIYLDPATFPWVEIMERYYSQIKSEYDAFALQQNNLVDICRISEEQFKVVKENEWKFIPLYFYGSDMKEFTKFFPATMEALSKIPHVTTAFFSILNPGTQVKEHRGAYKGYLRYQLGVKIPQPEELCGLKVEDEIYHWSAGKSVIFDDTYLHSAWNNSNETRVVLYVDFIRPMNPVLMYISGFITRLINRSPFVQNAIFNLNSELKKNNTGNK